MALQELKDGLNTDNFIAAHPCFNPISHLTKGRVHLPVSPLCNISCRFCKRELNKTEIRPGVTGCLITPDQAPLVVEKALKLCPEISVVGIAGPGDTLATGHAIQAFLRIGEAFPELGKCLSTNGLLLPQKLDDLLRAKLTSLTVTVNAVDPRITAKIVSHIIWNDRLLTDLDAGELLIRNQLKGISLAAEAGLTIKVNMVLVPGVNDHHVRQTAETVQKAGAKLFNLIPLIPQNQFSTLEAPTGNELSEAQRAAETYLPVFRQCQHCRADACGIPGKRDLSGELYGSLKFAETFSHG